MHLYEQKYQLIYCNMSPLRYVQITSFSSIIILLRINKSAPVSDMYKRVTLLIVLLKQFEDYMCNQHPITLSPIQHSTNPSDQQNVINSILRKINITSVY